VLVPRVPNARIVFGTLDGGILCPDCTSGHKQLVATSAETLDAWEALVDPFDRSEMWKRFPISPQVSGEIRRLSSLYVCSLLGKKPRLHDWWNTIAKNDRVPCQN